MKQPQYTTLTLEKIVGGGQTLGTLEDGRKAFVWGGLPGETVTIRITKKKSHFVEGVVSDVAVASPERVAPLDPASYLSTSPWQIMTFDAEQHYKAALIEEAFELHNIVLPDPIDVYTDGETSHYRNKVEFSWFGSKKPTNIDHAKRVVRESEHQEESAEQIFADAESQRQDPSLATYVERPEAERTTGAGSADDMLDLAFFMRGSKGKIPVDQCSLLPEPMMRLALAIRDLLQTKPLTARNLKTLLIRSDQQGNCVWQLYLKDELPDIITPAEAAALPASGGELIYSDPRSPASRITKRLAAFGDVVLTDTVLNVPFRYATEGFFQVNIPVYEQALRDMKEWVQTAAYSEEAGMSKLSGSLLDLYSGVGSIGLTIGDNNVTLVEINEDAVREMKRNITALGRETSACAVLAPSEKALDHITPDALIIVDPPRAGLHADVIAKLLETSPERILYLSCNPVTQARDVALLGEIYGVRAHRGYNFFPRTPHIEHLVILDRKP